MCGKLRSMETKESPAVSCKKVVQERRAAAKRERNRLYYQTNQQKIIQKVQEQGREIGHSTNQCKHIGTSSEIAQTRVKEVEEEAHAKEQARRAKIREQTRERVRRYHEGKQKEQEPEEEKP